MINDKVEIIEVINRYGLAVDSQDWQSFDSIFTPDIDADYGGGAHWTNLDEFKRDFAEFHKPFTATQHMMANHVIKLGDGTASSITYGRWQLVIKGAEGGDEWDGNGWYEDRLVKAGGTWLIKQRTCHILRWGGNPKVFNPVADVSFVQETKSLIKQREIGSMWFS